MSTRTVLTLLCALLLAGLPASIAGEPPEQGESQARPSPTEIEVGSGSDNVSQAVQGKDGVRIQTLCTHCNSANIQVGGLSQELVPISRNGYPVFGGLATSMILSMLPAESIAEAQVEKGPRSAEEPYSAAGGVMRFIEATPEELPWLELGLEAGSFDRTSGTVLVGMPIHPMVSASVVAGRETTDTVDDDQDGWVDVPAVEREFAEGRLNFAFGDRHKVDLGGSWIGENDTDGRGGFDWLGEVTALTQGGGANGIQDLGTSWTREDTLLKRRELRAGWAWDLEKGRKLELRALDADRDQRVLSQTIRDGQPAPAWIDRATDFYDRLDIDQRNRWAAMSYRQPIGLNAVFRGGIEYEDDLTEASSIEGTSFTPSLAANSSSTAQPASDELDMRSAFAELDWSISRRWDLQIGTRFDQARWTSSQITTIVTTTQRRISLPFGGFIVFDQINSTTGQLIVRREADRFLPRVALAFTQPNWNVKMLAGETMRAPRSIFDKVCCGQRYQVSGNTAAERGVTYGVEGTYEPSPDFRVNTYASRTDFDDHIVRLIGKSTFYIQTWALANIPVSRADTAEIALRWSPHPRVDLDGSLGWLSFRNRSVPTVETTVDNKKVPLTIDRVPYLPERTASASASVILPGQVRLSAQAGYTGRMMIQQLKPFPESGNEDEDLLLREMRETPGFWMVGLSFEAPIYRSPRRHRIELVGGVDNLTDRIQNDLGDRTTDYNWGPLTGRVWRLGLRYKIDG